MESTKIEKRGVKRSYSEMNGPLRKPKYGKSKSRCLVVNRVSDANATVPTRTRGIKRSFSQMNGPLRKAYYGPPPKSFCQ